MVGKGRGTAQQAEDGCPERTQTKTRGREGAWDATAPSVSEHKNISLAPRLDLRQSQSLVMTPQLQQAIKLLALSNLEIETFIGEALEANPLLEAGEMREGDAPA